MIMYSQPSSSSSTNPAQLDFIPSPLITYIPPIRYDQKGRQIHYVESAVQRRERVAFIRKREWARRVSAWIDESHSAEERHNGDDNTMNASGTKPPKVTWDVISIPESPEEYYDDNEPYIIYSSSSPSSPSSSTSALSDESYSPSSSPTSSRFSSRRSPRLRRRQLSLSSINEEPEED